MLWLNIRLFTCNAENYALAEYKSSFENEMRFFVGGLQMYAISDIDSKRENWIGIPFFVIH